MRFRFLPIVSLVTACALSGSMAGARSAAVVPKPWTPQKGTLAAPAPVAGGPATAGRGVSDSSLYLPDTTWLIQVGPRITRCKDFSLQYQLAYPEHRPDNDSLGLVQFMGTLIDHDLLGLAAQALNRPLDFADRTTLRETGERALSDVFYMRNVIDRVNVTDAEIAEYKAQRKYEGHFRRIRFGDYLTAKRVRAALVGGQMKWEGAVKQYALDKPTPQNLDGDLGWLARTSAADPEGTGLFRLRPGEISEVIRLAEGGYEVYQMLERRQLAKLPAFVSDSFVRVRLTNLYSAMIADSIQLSIGATIGLVFDTTNVAWASARFREAVEPYLGQGKTVHLSKEAPELSPEDTSRVLARWKRGGQFTLGQFNTWFLEMNPLVRPDVTVPELLRAQLTGLLLEPQRANLARESGLDKDPEVIARVEAKRERLLVEHMYQDSVAAVVGWVSREERKAYYESHKPDYFTFPSVDFAGFYRYTRAGADSLVKALDAGAKPSDILAADSLRGEKAGSIQHRNSSEHGNYQKVLFEELRPGHSTVLGPDRDRMYAVLHLIKYDPGRQLTFEESDGMVDETLQNLKTEQRLQALLQRLRRIYPVVSRPELVKRIQLVDPTGM